MIQASELRIGNYVGSESNSIFDGRIRGLINALEVVSIDSKGINAWQDHGASGIVKFEELFGLPLTEEWLLKFGFEYKHNHNEDGDETEWLQHKEYPQITVLYDVVCIYEHQVPNIEYVHQLQNLYFSLTGKELELKKENNAPSN